MVDKQDGTEPERHQAPKAQWTSPEVKRLLAGDAENNPGDSHSDGSATFS
jgi:hypothetical protein